MFDASIAGRVLSHCLLAIHADLDVFPTKFSNLIVLTVINRAILLELDKLALQRFTVSCCVPDEYKSVNINSLSTGCSIAIRVVIISSSLPEGSVWDDSIS